MNHSFETSIDIQQPLPVVWQHLINTKEYQQWNNIITSLSGSKRVGCDGVFIVHINDKSPIIWPIHYTTVKENEELAWEAKLVSTSVFKTVHYFRLASIDVNTTRFVHGGAYSGMLGAIVCPLVKTSRLALYGQFNRCLKIKCELLNNSTGYPYE